MVLQEFVERIDVLQTRFMGRKARVTQTLGIADALEQSPQRPLHTGRQSNPALILGLIDIARRMGWRAATRTRMNLTGQLVFGGLRAKHREQRLEQRQVDFLNPWFGRRALFMQSGQRQRGAVNPGDRICHRKRRQHRRPIRETVHRRKTTHRFDQ